ncbi:MAG: hypothetical protein H0T89_17195 [Deltaproteobacteria bacterium]|nr:hypothetical protein [Deltaproteobacteria bacterium]MDQ3294958.1 hypothetical protein [Myxococcota bacterium]
MKLVLAAVLFAIGCSSKDEPAASSGGELSRPTVTDPLGFCDRARMMMMGRRKCFPEDTSIKMGMESIVDLVRDAPAEPEARRRVAVTCAVMLQGMMRVEQPKNCPLDVTEGERAELEAFLAAWYGERTAAARTGHADTDTALVKLAGQRDAACACKDLACARQAGAELDAALPSDAPEAARDAAAKMVDEVTRCKQQLTNAPPR